MIRTILILSLALALIGCGRKAGNRPIAQSTTDRKLDQTTFDAAALALVQKETGVQLPRGSRGLNMFYQGSTLDPSFVAKIQVPDSSGDALAGRIKKIRSDNTTVGGSLTEKVTWWNPTNGTILVQRQHSPGGDFVRVILVQEKDRLVLYLEWIKI